MTECATQALNELPQIAGLEASMVQSGARFFVLLADAAEAQGDMERALEFDAKADDLLRGNELSSKIDQMPSHRRRGLVLLAAGKPYEAVDALTPALKLYLHFLEHPRFPFVASPWLRPVLTPVKLWPMQWWQREMPTRRLKPSGFGRMSWSRRPS